MDKNEKELDELFDDLKNTKLKKAVKKAKWHSMLRNVLISLVVLIVVLVGGAVMNQSLVYRMEGPTQIAVSSFNEISAPNQYIGKTDRYHGFLGGSNRYTKYKIIEGKVVYTGESEYHYGLFQDYQGNRIGSESPGMIGPSWNADDINFQKYNELGQREMVFFYPFIDYPKYKKDLELLDVIGENKIMEVALSFDQAYSMNEVNSMLPDDVTLSWYWIDDSNEEEKAASQSKQIEQMDENGKPVMVETAPLIRSERTAYGIKAYDASNQKQGDPLQSFIWALENGKNYDTRFRGEFERLIQLLQGEDGEITQEDIRVFGAVVTGDAKSLKALREFPFIKASSIGVITDKY